MNTTLHSGSKHTPPSALGIDLGVDLGGRNRGRNIHSSVEGDGVISGSIGLDIQVGTSKNGSSISVNKQGIDISGNYLAVNI